MEKKQKAKAAAYSGTQPGQNPVKNILKEVRRRKLLFLMLLPAIVFFIIFCYVPMGGIMLAFKDYNYCLLYTSGGLLPGYGRGGTKGASSGNF